MPQLMVDILFREKTYPYSLRVDNEIQKEHLNAVHRILLHVFL